MTSTTICFPKDLSIGYYAGKIKQKYFQKYQHKERLDPINFKIIVVL
jgi:hypothetical protein